MQREKVLGGAIAALHPLLDSRALKGEMLLQQLAQRHRKVGHLSESQCPALPKPLLDLGGTELFLAMLEQKVG